MTGQIYFFFQLTVFLNFCLPWYLLATFPAFKKMVLFYTAVTTFVIILRNNWLSVLWFQNSVL